MTNKRYKTVDELGHALGVSPERIKIAKMKTQLKKIIIKEARAKDFSASSLAEISGLSRTVISGILNGSLLSVSLERLIRLASALNISVELNIKNVA